MFTKVLSPGSQADASPGHAGTSVDTRNFAQLVEAGRGGDATAFAQLQSTFQRGLKFYFVRNLGEGGADELVHQSLMCLIQAVQKGHILEPDRLAGFVMGIATNVLRSELASRLNSRKNEGDTEDATVPVRQRHAETDYLRAEQQAVLVHRLKNLPALERAILERFYLLEQSIDVICQDLGLTATQFRQYKSRATATLIQEPIRFVERKGVERVGANHQMTKSA